MADNYGEVHHGYADLPACCRDVSIVVRVLCPWPGKDLFKLISGNQKAQPENHMSPAFG
jgi:hypothetical protein